MGAISIHVSSFILHTPGSKLDHEFVGGPTLKFINKKKQPGLFSRSRLILSSGTVNTINEMVSESYKEESGNPQKSAISGVGEPWKDNRLVFVTGATGKVGSRTVRELLKLGFHVRAGVRSLQRAEPLLESVAQLKLDSQSVNPSVPLRPTEEKKIELAVCDLEKSNEIRSAIGNARVVVCCIGASEKEVFDVTGPYRIDYQATKNLIDAASVANVDHFILLTSLGTSKLGFPAALLNLFWGVLVWKRKAEEALINSGLPYSIVRPGGMERPTDTYKETHNLVLAGKDTYFGGQVSNLQVAELIACMADNRELSINKVVEVIAETTAPLLTIKELLTKVPIAGGVGQKPTSELAASAPMPQSLVEQEASESAPPIIVTKVEQRQTAMRSLSPYPMYEDLKPPTSPTPKQC